MIGQVLGRYRMIEQLGRGGMATVYLAIAEVGAPGASEGTRVAVKVLHPHLLKEPGFFKRFMLEAEVGLEIRDPNVVRTLDVDAADLDGTTVHYLVMEYVEGQTLRAFVEEVGWFSEDLCLHIAGEVARALIAIHAAGLVHRDVKPENVLITEDETVKVMDLGVARVMDQVIRLSRTGQFVGSLLYAAPEQFQGKSATVDARADLYALGMMLYELSTGNHPFDEDSASAVIHRQLNDSPAAPSRLNPRISPFFEELVLTLLRKDPAERFETSDQLLEILSRGEASEWWQLRSGAIREETRRSLRRIRIPRETKLHGRSTETDRLRSFWEQVRQGEGRVALLSGEAGIGKSRLVDEFVGELEASGEELNFLFGAYPPGGAATFSGAFSTAYREHLGTADLTETLRRYLTVTPVLAPGFASLLLGEPPPNGEEALNKDSIQTVFIHLTRALAAEHPTLILIDALQFAPEEGLALFAALSIAVPGHRVLLIGATRPGLSPQWTTSLERLPHIQHMTLDRLGFNQVHRLLAEDLGSERLAGDLAVGIARHSDGNPFFIFELLRQLRMEERLIQRLDGKWSKVGLIREITVPYSVKDLVAARIARLSEEERDLLEVAACVGFEFDPVLITEALELGRIPTLKRLGRLERRHRLVHSCGRLFVFDHHQVQEVLYEGLSELLREEFHTRLGDGLERLLGVAGPEAVEVSRHSAVQLCEHFLRGGCADRARPYIAAALDHLENGHQLAQAIDLSGRCLGAENGLSGLSRAMVLKRRAEWLELEGLLEEEGRALEEALTLSEAENQRELALKIRLKIGYHRRAIGDTDEAVRILTESAELARALGDRPREAGVYAALASIHADQGRYDEARSSYERHRSLTKATGDVRGEAGALGNLALVAWETGQYEEALSRFRESLALFRRIGIRRGEGNVVGNMGLVYDSLGRFEKARECFELHRDISREIGYRRGEAMALGNLGQVCGALGLYAEALDSYEADLEIGAEIGNPMHLGINQMGMGGLWIDLGQFDRAREALGLARETFQQLHYRMGASYILEMLGILAEEEARPEQAEELLLEAKQLREELGFEEGVADALCLLGRFHMRRGEDDRARIEFEQCLELCNEDSANPIRALATVHLAGLPGGDPAGARQVLRGFEPQLSITGRMEAHFGLFRADGAEADLAEAGRLLSFLVRNAPEQYRESVAANILLHREIEASSV